MKNSLVSIAVGAFMTAISLFLLAIAYPKLFALLGLLLVTACIVFGLSLIGAIPKGLGLAYSAIEKFESVNKEAANCRYCGLSLPTNSDRCPNCGAATRQSSKLQCPR